MHIKSMPDKGPRDTRLEEIKNGGFTVKTH